VVRSVLVLVVLALAAMWVYVLFIGKEVSPNRLEDQGWAEQAEPVCATAAARVGALPSARSFAGIEPLDEALRQRAEVGQEATDLVAAQVAALRGLPPPTGPNDGALLTAWFADWDTYLGDRADHVAEWRAGRDRPFAETEADTGGPISDRMDALAKENGMPSCVVPRDFG
jgi:hypothetical protein